PIQKLQKNNLRLFVHVMDYLLPTYDLSCSSAELRSFPGKDIYALCRTNKEFMPLFNDLRGISQSLPKDESQALQRKPNTPEQDPLSLAGTIRCMMQQRRQTVDLRAYTANCLTATGWSRNVECGLPRVRTLHLPPLCSLDANLGTELGNLSMLTCLNISGAFKDNILALQSCRSLRRLDSCGEFVCDSVLPQ